MHLRLRYRSLRVLILGLRQIRFRRLGAPLEIELAVLVVLLVVVEILEREVLRRERWCNNLLLVGDGGGGVCISHSGRLMTFINDHMAKRMTATELKARILSVLDDVASGEEVEVTKHGRTVAKIVPAKGAHALRGKMRGIAASEARDTDLYGTGMKWNVERRRSR